MQHIIQPLIPYKKIKRYCEPFAGAAATFFNGHFDGISVTLNDLNGRLINFYRVVQNPELFEKLLIEVQGTLHSQTDFRRATRIYFNPKGHSRVKQAWAMWAAFMMAYLGDVHPGAGFRFSYEVRGGINKEALQVSSSKQNFKNLSKKLEGVSITEINAINCIFKTDSPFTLHFIDPPYHDSDMGHFENMGWNLKRFRELCFLLENIQGMFILTHTLTPELIEFRRRNGWRSKNFEAILAGSRWNGKENERFTKKRIESITWNFQEPQRRLF